MRERRGTREERGMWHLVPVTVNGYTYEARYSDEA